MRMRKKVLLAVGLLLLAVLYISLDFSTNCKTVHTTVTGRFYDMSDGDIEEPCKISVDGKYYTSAFRDNTFEGGITIDSDSVQLEEKTVELRFSDNIAVPVAKGKAEYQYTTRIHSVIRVENSSDFVIVLYNKYIVGDGSLTAGVDISHPVFICVGQISKEEAVDLIHTKT